MLPYAKIQGGTFTSAVSTAQNVQVSSMNPPDFFVMRNLTQWGSATAKDVEFFWERSMAQGAARGYRQTVTTNALSSFSLTSDGISSYSTANPPVFTPNTSVTAVTRGSAGGVTVVTLTNDGNVSRGPKIQTGDFVRLTNVSGMQQISGYSFQVVATTSTTSITIDLDSSGFAADGTTAVCQKIIPSQFYPRIARIITATNSNPAVFGLNYDSDFTIGEEVSFRIPPSMNSPSFTTMSQLNNLKGVVASVTPATSTSCSLVTVNVDTSGFSTFSLPTSAQAALGVVNIPSLIVPAGSGVLPGSPSLPGMNIQDAFDNRNQYVIHLGGTMFANTTAGDTWSWQAYRYDEYNNQ